MLSVYGKVIATDPQGYLLDSAAWSIDVANLIATEEDIQLTDAHWEIIYAMQAFYKAFQKSPAMRPFINYLRRKLSEEKGQTLYLYKLFPNGAKQVSKIAGLPKPDHCL